MFQSCRPKRAALNLWDWASRRLLSTGSGTLDYTHTVRLQLAYWGTETINKHAYTSKVIGGGIVGLAIAKQLSARNGTRTLVIERHGVVGSETSSRNSEVRTDLSLLVESDLITSGDTCRTILW